MKTYTESECKLETRERRGDLWLPWYYPLGRMYDAAKMLAHSHRPIEAIEAAQDARIATYGDMHGVQFRCVTTSRTVTGPIVMREDE